MLYYYLLVIYSSSTLISNNYCFAKEPTALQNTAKIENTYNTEPKNENYNKCDCSDEQQQNLNLMSETQQRKKLFETSGQNIPNNLLFNMFRTLPYIPKQSYVRKNTAVKSNYVSPSGKNVINEDLMSETQDCKNLFETSGQNIPNNLLFNMIFRTLPYIPKQPYIRKDTAVKSNGVSRNGKQIVNKDLMLSDGVQSSETMRKNTINERKIKKNDDKQNSDYLNLDTYKKSMLFIKGVNCEICSCPIHLSYNPDKCTVCPC